MNKTILVTLLASIVWVSPTWAEEDLYYEDDMLTTLLLEQGAEILDACEVDYNSMLESSKEMMGAMAMGGEELNYDNALQQLQELAVQCTGGQPQEFDQALQDFHQCSEIDLHTVLESFADALVGSLLQCSLAIAPLADQMEDPNFTIPDICIESFMGRNPFGDLVRSYLLFPDKLLPCFSSLSKAIPECTLEEWPIPLIGKLMKKVFCILGGTVDLVDEMAAAQVELLSSCLEGDNPCLDKLVACAEGAVTLVLPKPLQGAPLSDAMIRAAQGVPGVVDKYNAFVETCIPDRWVGWTYEFGAYDDSLTDQENNLNSPVAPQNNYMQEQQPQQTPKNVEAPAPVAGSSSSSPFGPFLGGLLTGLVLVGGVWAFTLYKRKKGGFDPYQSVEMIGGDLSLA